MAPSTSSMAKAVFDMHVSESHQTSSINNAAPAAESKTSKAVRKSTNLATKQKPLPLFMSFRLLDLPQEVVDMIYVQMIRAGHTNILRTSQAVYARALQLLKGNGIFKISAQYCRESSNHQISASTLTEQMASSINNIDIRISRMPSKAVIQIYKSMTCTFGNSPLGKGLLVRHSPLSHFTGSSIHRATCRITVEVNMVDKDDFDHVFHCERLFKTLRRLTGFNYLSFVCVSRPKISLSEYFAAKSNQQATSSDDKQKSVYEVMKRELEPSLGPGLAIDDGNQFRKGLEFYPLRYRAAVAEKGS